MALKPYLNGKKGKTNRKGSTTNVEFGPATVPKILAHYHIMG